MKCCYAGCQLKCQGFALDHLLLIGSESNET
jgi:hypothetical protein